MSKTIEELVIKWRKAEKISAAYFLIHGYYKMDLVDSVEEALRKLRIAADELEKQQKPRRVR